MHRAPAKRPAGVTSPVGPQGSVHSTKSDVQKQSMRLADVSRSIYLQGIDWLVDGLADAPAGAEGIVPGGQRGVVVPGRLPDDPSLGAPGRARCVSPAQGRTLKWPFPPPPTVQASPRRWLHTCLPSRQALRRGSPLAFSQLQRHCALVSIQTGAGAGCASAARRSGVQLALARAE